MNTIAWIIAHRKSLKIAVFIASVGLLSLLCGILYKLNKSLSEGLEIAQTNVLAYLGLLNGSLLANNVLRLLVDELNNSKDSLLLELNKVRELLAIKERNLKLAATETQTINVSASKQTDGKIIVKDSIYNDSIYYNNLTKVYYTIGNDTVRIALDIKNTEYFYVYNNRHYKNNKKFLKRLFTWDWKKINTIEYNIVNTNELFNILDVRVVEITK